MINNKYGRLLVLEKNNEYLKDNSKYICQCDCGNKISCFGFSLKDGNTTSCGCYNKEIITKHGMYNTPEYNAYTQMKQRCYNVNNKRYSSYGARGVLVCSRWLNNFNNFIEDMGKKPSLLHSLDRIDVNGNYEPSNCRWATDYEQRTNKQNTILYEINGIELHMSGWAKKLKIDKGNFNKQINKNGFEYVYNRIINKQNKNKQLC